MKTETNLPDDYRKNTMRALTRFSKYKDHNNKSGGSVLPAIKWLGSESNNYSSSGLEERLQRRVFGKLKSAALKEVYRIVRDNGGLDISSEYGSLEIQDIDFAVLSLSLSYL